MLEPHVLFINLYNIDMIGYRVVYTTQIIIENIYIYIEFYNYISCKINIIYFYIITHHFLFYNSISTQTTPPSIYHFAYPYATPISTTAI